MMMYELTANFCVVRFLRFNFKVKASFKSFCSTMTTQESRRLACFEAFRAGKTVRDTADFFNYSLRSVYDLKKRFDEELAAGSKPEEVSLSPLPPNHLCDSSFSREKDIRTQQFVTKFQKLVDEDPSRSIIRSLAREKNVSAMTVHRCVHEDLRYKSYVLRQDQMMIERQRPGNWTKPDGCCSDSRTPGS